jgi:[ribosomal protein S18]-alanine N-acetyltransferase
MSGQQTSTRQQQAPTEQRPLLWSLGGHADSGAAALLADRAFDPHYREAWSETQIGGLLASPGSWLDLGRESDVLVAFALSRHVFDEVELLLCAVDPAWRSRGVGQRLMDRAVDGARGRGARRMFLEVRASNEAALSLYRSFGFRPDGRRPGYYRTSAGESIDAITLSLSL